MLNKNSIYLSIITLLSLFTVVSARADVISIGTIDGINVVDTLVGSSTTNSCFTVDAPSNACFYNQNSGNNLATINDAQLESDITDSLVTTYIVSTQPSYIDLAFSNVDIYNGDGADLVFLFAGNSFSFQFDLLDGSGPNIFDVTPDDAVVESDGTRWLINGALLSAVFVDLDDFGYAKDIPLGTFRLNMGDQLGTPFLAMAGGFHTQVAVVPLPLSIVLFTSGLGVLGFFSRRCKA